MPATLIEGAYTTASGATEERPYAHEVKLYERNPDEAPFLAMLTRLASEEGLTDPRFYDYVLQRVPDRSTLASNYTAASGSMAVASGTGKLFRVGNFIVLPRTGTQFVITGVSTDTLSVTASGEGADANALAGDQVLLVGGRQEGGTTPTALSARVENDYNVTANISEAVNTTWEEMQTATRPGEKIGQKRKDNLRNAYARTQRQLSNLLYFAQRAETMAADGKPLRMGRGILRWITSGTAGNERAAASNILPVGGTKVDLFILNDLVAMCAGTGSVGTKTKLLVMGPAARNALWGPLTASGHWRSDEEANKKLGFRLEEVETSSGPCKVICDYTLSGTGGYSTISGSTANNGAGNYIFCVDLMHLRWRWMRKLLLYRGVTADEVPGGGSRYDGVVDEYIGTGLVSMRFPEAHAVASGIGV